MMLKLWVEGGAAVYIGGGILNNNLPCGPSGGVKWGPQLLLFSLLQVRSAQIWKGGPVGETRRLSRGRARGAKAQDDAH